MAKRKIKRKITPLNMGMAFMIFIVMMYFVLNAPSWFGEFKIFFVFFPFLFVVTFLKATMKAV